ncbi:hypothetical protein HPB52_015934 [Rhipicephalus sanguineus]|uniref:Regulatory protein zeste n=1 Tax=Rhipicephalus sanguineus TaxID=34632 RepID=A0A9D4SUM8_RHISA|nr:hypothetical protein HPB52_015934 [Rhipicephalus sanguineus]
MVPFEDDLRTSSVVWGVPGPLSRAGTSASSVGLSNVLTDDLAKKERLQQRHYALFSELQQMAKDVPLNCQQRLPYELLSSLANSLLDGTVFDIVRGLKDIQMMEEQSLMETRRTVVKSQAETKAELIRRQKEQREALLSSGAQSVDFIDMAQEKETKALDQMHKEELIRVDMKIITQLDQLLMLYFIMAIEVESAPSSEEARVDDTKPRVYRTTALQFEMMLEYIERHPYMVRTVHYPQSVALREHHWKLLTERLNADDLKPHKTKARWKKTYFDWKSTVRAKLRSPAGQNALTPLDKRLIAVLRFLDSHQAPLARKDAMPQAEVVYKVGGSSNAVHIGE